MKPPHVVIVIANLPLARDHRVQKQAEALLAAGARVTVVSPQDVERRGLPSELLTVQTVDYRLPVAGGGVVSFALEFAWSFVAVTLALFRLARRDPFDAVQFCNPPDVFFPLMWLARLRGIPAVYDEHDLVPELYASRGSTPASAVLRVVAWFERRSERAASAVVTVNDSYRDVVVHRGGVPSERVTVVRNAPRLTMSSRPRGECVAGHRHRVVYVGVMGAQDGVGTVVRTAAELAERRPGDDWEFVLVGDGEMLPELRTLAATLGVGDRIRFTGWLSTDGVAEELANACVGLQPDPRSPHAEVSTMVKTTEYLVFGVPVVAVDLKETRRSAGDAAVYVAEADPASFAEVVNDLLDDDQRRVALSAAALRRSADGLTWEVQAQHYVELYRRLVPTGWTAEPGTGTTDA